MNTKKQQHETKKEQPHNHNTKPENKKPHEEIKQDIETDYSEETQNKLILQRIEKLNKLKDKGINPYPYKYTITGHSNEIKEKYDKLENEETTNDYYSVAGRILLLRKLGKVTFITLQDQYGKIQLMLRINLLNEQYDLIDLLDMGDIIGAEGSVIKTKTGEISIQVEKLELLSKSIRPLPEKFHGLKDPELRYRMRYLDMIINPEVKDVFIKRTRIFDTFRKILNEKNFIEADTPILQQQYGGANARPFKTFLNAWNMPVYLRISNELYLKRLLVGGFERVYEFSKDFRNEGADRTHNPEFTQIEIYQAYADYNDMMELTELLVSQACLELNGSYKVKYGDHTLNFQPPWRRMTMKEAIHEYGDIDINSMDDSEILSLVKKHNLEIEGEETQGKVIMALFEKYCEEKLIQPTFITEYPVESTPLCKPDPKDKAYLERFEAFCATFEIGNAYSELNDPILQRKFLEEQAKELRAGAEEAHPMDEDFVRAIEVGMPPAGGVGIGIDRIAMLLTNSRSIRDILSFPFMKPEGLEAKKE